MRPHKKYRITIEDESHLTEVATVRISALRMWAYAGVLFIITLLISGLMISFTPLRTLLPGYLKESQRSATEEGLLRLDSLTAAYEMNQAFIDNFLKVSDIDREPSDSSAVTPVSRELTSDSLMTATGAEQRFVSQMEERERFNISVLAPLAADGVSFSPLSDGGVFTKDSRTSEEGIVLLPGDESVLCAADGAVVALYFSPSDKGYVVAVQHNRGFLTTYTHLGSPLVGVGDNIAAGQVLALAPSPDARGKRYFKVRMWHNGLPIVPYDYLSSPEEETKTDTEKYESPRGKL